MLNRSPISQTCHQHIWSPTSVTNIDVTFHKLFSKNEHSQQLLRFTPKSPIKDLSKEFLDTKLLLIKCHLMNEDESVALRLLNETQPSLELIYGLVSDESAKALEMSGSLELAKGNMEIAYHKLNNAYQVYQALDHKHKQVNNQLRIFIGTKCPNAYSEVQPRFRMLWSDLDAHG